MPKILTLALGTVLAFAAQPGGQLVPSAAELAGRIQTHYDTVHDFRANFAETYTSATLGQKESDRGSVRIKKPNRMYWTYTAPAKKFIVADGSRIFVYDPTPGDPTCTVTPIAHGDQIPQGVMFLAGRGNLVRDFTSTVPTTQPSNGWQLDLVPNVPQDDFTALSLVVDRASLALQAFITRDREGNLSRFDFNKLQENVGLDDREFMFTAPHGVICEAPTR